MHSNDYLDFKAEDFASDSFFQKWVLEDDYMTNLFWEKWLLDNPSKIDEVNLAKKIIKKLNFKSYKVSSKDFNEVWKNIKELQAEKKDADVFSNKSSKKKWYTGIVASIILLISFNIVYKGYFNREDDKEIPLVKNNIIKAGEDKAVLTLENGDEVLLVKGETYKAPNVNSNGETIVYNTSKVTKDIVYNYLTTPKGGQFFVKLSDGTQVWLNSESRLKYPVAFVDNDIRQVELVYGEAYFDVSPSNKHKGAKFKVVNQAQDIVVLGTEFNIKAYKDEPHIYTTLVEGKVTVNSLNNIETLKPNQQFVLNYENNKSFVSTVDVYREVSWKDGVFSFKNKTLKEIMKVLSRWYDINPVFNNETVENIVFNGSFKKKTGVVEILELIKTSDNTIDYEVIDKTVLLKNK